MAECWNTSLLEKSFTVKWVFANSSAEYWWLSFILPGFCNSKELTDIFQLAENCRPISHSSTIFVINCSFSELHAYLAYTTQLRVEARWQFRLGHYWRLDTVNVWRGCYLWQWCFRTLRRDLGEFIWWIFDHGLYNQQPM